MTAGPDRNLAGPTEPQPDDPRFAEYRRTRDRRLRNELIESNRELALRLASRFANRGEPSDDLVQVAMVGLLKAVERFEPERGLAFSSFATPTITGEIKRHFRDKTWSMRVPRRTQELRLAVRSATDRFHQELGRPPSVSELAGHLEVSVDDVIEALASGGAYRPGSLTSPPGDDPEERSLESQLGHDPAEHIDEHHALREVLHQLPEREQQIIVLRFFGDLTQSEIAVRLGISQMHVSRLLRRTLLELRTMLELPGELDEVLGVEEGGSEGIRAP